MSKLSDFLTTNKIDSRRVVGTSRTIEKQSGPDKLLMAKKSAIKAGKAEKDEAVTKAKPKSGRRVTQPSIERAAKGEAISGPAKQRIVRAVNAILVGRKKPEVGFRDLFERCSFVSAGSSSKTASDAQAAVYETRAAEYDALISAEDVDRALPLVLDRLVRIDGARVADVGAGTGRFARLLARRAEHVHLIDRAAPMLEVARERLASDGIANVSIHVSDARSLPLPDQSVDLAVAGWVFGHFPHWMPDDWRTEVQAALTEMRRVVKPEGSIVIVETLGTGHEVPRKHEKLDPYFEWLMRVQGFTQTIIRTDYGFRDVETAARICGSFFGEPLAATIRENGWARVPECTSVFVTRASSGSRD